MNNNDIYSSSKAEKRANGSNKKKSRIIAAVLAAVALIAIICLLCFKGCTPDANPIGKLTMDDNAVEGGWNEADIDEIKKGLNEKVEAGMINISMNTSPVFENGSSEGNLMIVNETINNYPQKVVISRNDTDEVVYESAGIPVGSKIERAKLNVNLPAGTYECTAMFHNMNPDTGESLGCAGAIITITVKN